jgi:hypothetical protein
MAGTRSRTPVRIETLPDRRKWFIFGTAVAVCTIGAIVYAYFHHSVASTAQRGDRIDFSSLATVVAIEEDTEWRSRLLNSGEKDDKLGPELSLASATTVSMKTNLGETLHPPEISSLVAKHAAKLQKHLEQGLMSGPGPTREVAASLPLEAPAVATVQSAAVMPASLRQLEPAVGKVSNVRSSLGGGLRGSTAGKAAGPTGGIRGSVSGLLH